MFVKKFESETIEGGLKKIKEELGPNALILSTTTKKGNWLGKSLVEITAAYEPAPKKTEKLSDTELKKIFPHRRYNSFGATDARPRDSKTEGSDRYIDLVGTEETPSPSRGHRSKYEDHFQRLGFAPETSKDFASRLMTDYPAKDLQNKAYMDRAKFQLLGPTIRPLTKEQILESHSFAVLGTPGQGRTSFLVKLAIYLKQNEKNPILVGKDQRKVVSQMELASYAKLIKVPFLRETEKAPQGVQLFDLPSLGSTDAENQPIAEVLDNTQATPILVLDATSRLNELMRIVQNAVSLHPEGIVFTKCDQASQRGIIFDVLKRSKLPLLGLSWSNSFKVQFRPLTNQEVVAYLLRRGEL